MPETTEQKTGTAIAVRYRGRGPQVRIYLGKLLRMFIYQSDWKVLPMAAIIAGLVSMVMKGGMFRSMEGTLMGAYAMVMVCIWNGCFNSIQVICRERGVIKREHRSGMHISSYVLSHMLYQAFLCLLQTAITLYVTKVVGMRYDLGKPLLTPWFIVDFGLTMFLITYAADMMALWISTLARNTTAAMTVMPFVLIFQLVFSGGMFNLPEWSGPVKALTISSPGLNALAAQADYNHQPLVALWNTVQSMGDRELSGTVNLGEVLDYLSKDTSSTRDIRAMEVGTDITVGQALDFLSDDSKPLTHEIRSLRIDGSFTWSEIQKLLNEIEKSQVQQGEISEGKLKPSDFIGLLRRFGMLKDTGNQIGGEMTLGEVIDAVVKLGLMDDYRDEKIEFKSTVGQVVDAITADDDAYGLRGEDIPVKTTVAELQQLIGVEKVRVLLQEKAAAASIKPQYEYSQENVLHYWGHLALFILVFSALATVALEFIDKDRR